MDEGVKKPRKPRKKKSVRSRTVRPKRRGQYVRHGQSTESQTEIEDSESQTEDSQSQTEDSQSQTEDSQSQTDDSQSQTDDSQSQISQAEDSHENNDPLDSQILEEQDASTSTSKTKPVVIMEGFEAMEKDLEYDNVLPYEPPEIDLIRRVLTLLSGLLFEPWRAIADSKSIHLLHLSGTKFSAIQREIIIHFNGQPTEIAIHCVQLSEEIISQISEYLPPLVPLEESTMDIFVSRCLLLTRNMRQFEICPGAFYLETEEIWHSVPESYIDFNPYFEDSYSKTCRSNECHRLKPFGKNFKRCAPCSKIMRSLRERSKFASNDAANPNTPNKYLNIRQLHKKLEEQHEEIRKRDKRIAYLEGIVKESLDTEGVELDDDVSLDLNEIMCSTKLTEVQKLFLQQQLEASSKTDARGHRWHPAMIRLALSIKMTSTSAYDALRDSGAIKLPCKRTLFNYTNFVKPQEGISPGLIEFVCKQVNKQENCYQRYFALLVDEMYISKNLIYRSSDGKLIGYSNLDEVDKEILELEKRLQAASEGQGSVPKPAEPILANKILAFMVKGLCCSIKCVVASFPCSEMNKDMLYSRSWDVIAHLESAGIKILCYVCDGNASNRGFFNMHVPLTEGFDVVFDTVNFCSPERRPLFFVSDVCHLLKTARNCFHNSGKDGKKTRCLHINGQCIEWKSIVRLYFQYKNDTFRKSYKLSPLNVFINSYSAMRVDSAAKVMSNSVADDLENQKWPETSETVKFLRMFNKFFDCLNGAHSSQHIKTRNKDLAPYTDENDERFLWLENVFLKYLKDWKAEVDALVKSEEITAEEAQKRLLSHQTLEGLEISIRSICASITFLLREGAQFVMARAFSQDPLEQHFSRQRAGFGGSTNPNASQFTQRAASLALQGQLGIKRRRGNVRDEDEQMEILSEPLPKRQCKRKSC